MIVYLQFCRFGTHLMVTLILIAVYATVPMYMVVTKRRLAMVTDFSGLEWRLYQML